MDLADLNKASGSNAPGLANVGYIAPKSWFDTIQTTIDPPVLAGDTRVIDGDHTFLAGKGFVLIYTTYKTAEYIAEKVGEPDSVGFNKKVEAFHPGTSAEFAEFLAEDDEHIAMFGDVNCASTRYFQLGSKCLPAKVSGSLASGKAGGEGKKGYSFMIESYADGPLFYDGVLSLYP